jgi:hypothetical protein
MGWLGRRGRLGKEHVGDDKATGWELVMQSGIHNGSVGGKLGGA